MKRIYTAKEMRQAERLAVDKGNSFEALMEKAGQGVATDLLNRITSGKLNKPKTVLIICGKGNNAGDGLVIARVLAAHDIHVKLYFALGENLSALAASNLARLDGFGIEVLNDKTLLISKDNDWIIDAVFGTGFEGKLPEHISQIMFIANQSNSYRIALDIPTGLNCDSGDLDDNAFAADLSYTFAAYKPAHLMVNGSKTCGEIVLIDIGV